MKISSVEPNLTAYFANKHEELPEVLSKAFLFGSFARGNARVGSDVDVALVAQEAWDFEDRNKIRNWLDGFNPHLKINPFFTTHASLENTDDKFNANYWIAREGVLIWEK